MNLVPLFSLRPPSRVAASPALRRWRSGLLFVSVCWMLLGSGARAEPREVGSEAALRAALADPGVTEVALTASVTLAGGELVVTRPLRLTAPGDDPLTRAPRVRLIGGGAHRILRVAAGAGAVEISGLGFEGGRGGALGGGALLVEPGASVAVSDCDFSGNATDAKGPGGAVLSAGSLRLERCRVTGNTAALGGGVAATAGQLFISACLFHRNVAAVAGGALHVTDAEVRLQNSTIAENSAGTAGGLLLASSAVAGGVATGGLRGVTLAHNSDRGTGGGVVVDGAGAVLEVEFSILAHNSVIPTSQIPTPLDLGVRRGGRLVSLGGNLVLAPGSSWLVPGPGDQFAVEPRLGALGHHGGRTQVYPLGAASPARDRGLPSGGGALATDQRGFPRVWPQDGQMDAGAFEFSAGVEIHLLAPSAGVERGTDAGVVDRPRSPCRAGGRRPCAGGWAQLRKWSRR
jgi:hypothetical protein